MILDSSALIAVLRREPGFEAFLRAIQHAPVNCISAVTLVGTSMVIEARGGAAALLEFEAFVSAAQIVIEPVDQGQASAARRAYSAFGKGKHAENMNLGDCFSYALAKATGERCSSKEAIFGKRMCCVPRLRMPEAKRSAGRR